MPAIAEDTTTYGFVSDCQVRAIDEDKRTAIFVAATEGGVETWEGIEYLRMSGIDLARYKRNPIVVDSHNIYESGAVIGRAFVKIEGRDLVATVTFATTVRAEELWQLVRDDFLRAVSVRFRPLEIEEVGEGKSSGRGDNKIEGPARVVKRWELYELSLVSLPADPDALRRMPDGLSAMREITEGLRDLRQEVRSLQNKENRMSDDDKNKQPEKDTKQLAKDVNESGTRAPEKETITSPPELRTNEAILQERVMAICPNDMKATAERYLLEGKPFDEIRTLLLKEHAEKRKPVGTPSTDVIDTDGADKPKDEQHIDNVDDNTLRRSITGQ